jgi:predicted small secreted protein
MKRSPIVIAAVGLAALGLAGCGGTRTVTKTVTVTLTGPAAPLEVAQFGYISSLTRKGPRFELRFDPAWLLSGVTAQRAKQEDTGSSDVPNDYYVVNEGPRLLTYLVPPGARVTIVGNGGKGIHGVPITVAQLAQLAGSKNPLGHPLFEPLSTGFWIVVRSDTVRSLAQQYFP